MENLVTVKRLNKILNVPRERLHYYLNEGYDQIDENGEIVKLATGGRTVALGEHNRLLQRVHELEQENKALRKLLEVADKTEEGPADEDSKEEKAEGTKRTRRRKASE